MGIARRTTVVLLALLAGVALLVLPERTPRSVTRPGLPIHEAQRPEFTMAMIRPHLAALEQIAVRNGRNRAHATTGYLESVTYVQGLLNGAGFQTRTQSFPHRRDAGINLIADWPGGHPNDVLIIGAHLDSVAAGPGINDNGSGSSAILALALAVAATEHRPQRHLRFVWWGAEETGLIGSKHYVAMLKPEERRQISGYLNVDMIASSNGGHFVYDSDDSLDQGFGPGGPGSARIEALLLEYYAQVLVPTVQVDFDQRSDYAPFFDAGIAVGGILAGSNQQINGQPADPCYHQDCDTLSNINEKMLVHNTNAVAYTVWALGSPPTKEDPDPSTCRKWRDFATWRDLDHRALRV